MSTFRRRVEVQAGPAVILLARLPRIVPFLLVAALLVGGLLTRGAVGALLLLVLSGLLGLLLLLGWPALNTQARALRSAVVAALVVRAVLFLL
ncbi:MAG: hypothetical protein JWM02_3240 [Frankiales bacterium]|nr:hypothetical protein [Frankiales bacterium]